jgi:hypothetical protein
VPGVRYERRVASGVLGMSGAVTPDGVRRGCVDSVLECCFLPYVCFLSFTPWLWGRSFCAGYLDSGAGSHGLLYLRHVGH